jgi:hypothetical protein
VKPLACWRREYVSYGPAQDAADGKRPQIIGRAGSPLHAESAAPTGVVALPVIETPSFPTLRQRGLCGFIFYLGNPFSAVPGFLIKPSVVAPDTDALQKPLTPQPHARPSHSISG